jgi:hypothetical protein
MVEAADFSLKGYGKTLAEASLRTAVGAPNPLPASQPLTNPFRSLSFVQSFLFSNRNPKSTSYVRLFKTRKSTRGKRKVHPAPKEGFLDAQP